MFFGCAGGKAANVKWTALSGFSVSLVIELSQLLKNRRPDVDDLLMNALGTALGGAIYICARKIEGRDQIRPPIYALLTCTLVMLRGIFCYIMHWGQPHCGMIFNICICN